MRKSSRASTSRKRSIARPAGHTSASRKNGRADICRKSRISWNASRPVGSRSRISRWPLRRSRSTTPAIGPPKRAVASHCEILAPQPAWPLAEALDAEHRGLGGGDRRFGQRENRVLGAYIGRPDHRDMLASVLHHHRRRALVLARERRVRREEFNGAALV